MWGGLETKEYGPPFLYLKDPNQEFLKENIPNVTCPYTRTPMAALRNQGAFTGVWLGVRYRPLCLPHKEKDMRATCHWPKGLRVREYAASTGGAPSPHTARVQGLLAQHRLSHSTVAANLIARPPNTPRHHPWPPDTA